MPDRFTKVFFTLWLVCAALWLAGSAAAGVVLLLLTFSPLLIALVLVVFCS